MNNPIVFPSLVPLMATYRTYFMRSETDTFCGHYVNVLRTYKTDTENASANTDPSEVSCQIYAMAQEGVPTAFLQWHRSAGRGGSAQIALLHSVSSYINRMGVLPSPWDNLSFISKGEVTCGTAMCAETQTWRKFESTKLSTPPPFVGIFLKRNLMQVEAWSCFRGAIVDAKATLVCRPIIYWLQVALRSKIVVDQP